jgi:hypothetical protein
MVACRKPKTREAAEGSTPSESRRQHDSDLVRGGFQAVEGGSAPGTERRARGLRAKGLNLLGLAMLPIPDECVDVGIADAEGRARRVGTGVAFSIHALGVLPDGF